MQKKHDLGFNVWEIKTEIFKFEYYLKALNVKRKSYVGINS